MQLGWIDFLKEDRQKALDVINLLLWYNILVTARPNKI